MTRHCDLRVARTDNGYVVRVQGSGTSADSPALADFVNECFQQEPHACVAVDLLGCEYLDSTFLGCLLNLQRAGTATRFRVVADEAARKKLLAATHVDSCLKLIPTAPKSATTFVAIEGKRLGERELGQHMADAHQALSELPSEMATAFRQIAEQLRCELEQQPADGPDLTDTVVMRVNPRP